MKQNGYEWVKLEELNNFSSNTDSILVNSNRIYWQISEIGRTIQDVDEKMNIISTLTEQLKNIHNSQSMYIPMQISDIKKCFKSSQDLLPLNTFVKANNKIII